MCGTFEEKITVLDEWENGSEKYRLVDVGAGPKQLQVFKRGGWYSESECYKWGIITDRLIQLALRPIDSD